MTLRLSDLLNGRRPLTVELDEGKTIEIVYNPGVLTPEMAAEVAQIREAPVAAMLSRVLLEWDMYDDTSADAAGNPPAVPTDFDTLRRLPSKFLQDLQRAIMADVFDTKNSGKPSENGSSREGSSEKHRTSFR